MPASCPVTVAICTRDRPDALRDVVADVLAQAPGDAQVLVVDQSEDPTATDAWFAGQRDPRLRRDVHAARGLPDARNHALALAVGRVVLFLDDDARLRPGCVSAHVAAYQDPGVGAVAGRIVERVVRPNATPGTCRIDAGGRARCNLDGGAARDVESLKGANMSFRRLALTGLGGFDPGYGGTALLEEADVAARLRAAGWRLRYAPDAAVDHLSLPSGGCRAPSVQDAEVARFQNTGRWVARHRPWGVVPVVATYAAVAVKRAAEWGDPGAASRLMAALAQGLRAR
jgi:GT2 family glycosyltransferase